MPNIIDANGLQTKSQSELLTEYTNGLKVIYGADINLDPDSPDGQQANLTVQMVLDILDLIVEVYGSFDPDNAIGRVLDKRVAYNGIQRKGGSYTLTNITVTNSRIVSLVGLDAGVNSVDNSYKVSDDAGNEYVLTDSVTIPIGTSLLQFRAVEMGRVESVIGTINNPVDIVLGVDAVDNLSGPTFIGEDQEKDQDLKLRRQRSVSRASSGYLVSLQSELEAIDGLTSVQVYENKTSVVNSIGVPPHGIWVIIAGLATDQEIGTAIYKKRNGGLNMRGDESYTYTQVDGSPFILNWDIATPETLYASLSVQPIDGVTPVLVTEIENELPNIYKPKIGSSANINELIIAVNKIDANALVTAPALSVNGGFYAVKVEPTKKSNQLTLATNRISITVL